MAIQDDESDLDLIRLLDVEKIKPSVASIEGDTENDEIRAEGDVGDIVYGDIADTTGRGAFGAMAQKQIDANKTVQSTQEISGLYNKINAIYYSIFHTTDRYGMRYYPIKVKNDVVSGGILDCGVEGYYGRVANKYYNKLFNTDNFITFDIASVVKDYGFTNAGEYDVMYVRRSPYAEYDGMPLPSGFEAKACSPKFHNNERYPERDRRYLFYQTPDGDVYGDEISMANVFRVYPAIMKDFENKSKNGKMRNVSLELSKEGTLWMLFIQDTDYNYYAAFFPTGINFHYDASQLTSDFEAEAEEKRAEKRSKMEANAALKTANYNAFAEENKDNCAVALYNAYHTSFGLALKLPATAYVPKDANGNNETIDMVDANGNVSKMNYALFEDIFGVRVSQLNINKMFNRSAGFKSDYSKALKTNAYFITKKNGYLEKNPEGNGKFQVEHQTYGHSYYYDDIEDTDFTTFDFTSDYYIVSKDMGVMICKINRFDDHYNGLYDYDARQRSHFKSIYRIMFTGLVNYDANGNIVSYNGPKPNSEAEADKWINDAFEYDKMNPIRAKEVSRIKKLDANELAQVQQNSVVNVDNQALVIPNDPRAYMADTIKEFVSGLAKRLPKEQFERATERMNTNKKKFYLNDIITAFVMQYQIPDCDKYWNIFRNYYVKPVRITKKTENVYGDLIFDNNFNAFQYLDDLFNAYQEKVRGVMPKVFASDFDLDATNKYAEYKLLNQLCDYNYAYSIKDGGETNKYWYTCCQLSDKGLIFAKNKLPNPLK